MIFKRRKRYINLTYDDSKKRFNKLLQYFAILFSVHVAVFWAFEPTSLFDSIWVSVISITTIGYGDISATTTIGKLTTMFVVGAGIFVLANLVDAFISLKGDIKDAKRAGKWKWNLEDHIIIANFPNNYHTSDIVALIKAIRKLDKFKDKTIQILTDRFHGKSLPDEIFNLRDVVLYNGIPSNTKSLEAVNIKKASDVIILNLHDDNDPDGYAFDIIRRVRDFSKDVNIVAQCQVDSERQRLYDAGANSCIRPVRAYPEIIAHVMDHNSIMVEFFEDLMSKHGDELLLIDIEEKYKHESDLTWLDIVSKLTEANRGLPLGFVSKNGDVFYNPEMDLHVEMSKLILLEYDDACESTVESILFESSQEA